MIVPGYIIEKKSQYIINTLEIIEKNIDDILETRLARNYENRIIIYMRDLNVGNIPQELQQIILEKYRMVGWEVAVFDENLTNGYFSFGLPGFALPQIKSEK